MTTASPPSNRTQNAAESMARELMGRIDALRPRSFFLLVLAPILALYLATASWSSLKSPDPMTNSVMAWNLGKEATFVLEEHVEWIGIRGSAIFVVDGDGRPVGQYPPGTALFAAPFYAIWPGDTAIVPAGDSRRPDDTDLDLVVPPLGAAALVAMRALHLI